MNTGREGPAEAWTPTEGNGFAIRSSSTSSRSLCTGPGAVTSMIEDGKTDRCAFTRSCHGCARIRVHACVRGMWVSMAVKLLKRNDDFSVAIFFLIYQKRSGSRTKVPKKKSY